MAGTHIRGVIVDGATGGLHAFEDGAYDATDDTAFGGLFGAGLRHVLLELMGETGDGEGLEPDSSGAGEGGEEDAVATEDHVADAGDAGDLEADAGLEGADVAGMHAEGFARGEVFDDDFAGEFEPCGSLPGELLEEEAVTTEDAGAEGLLEAYAEFDAVGGTEKAVAVDEIFVAVANGDREDLAGDAGGEGDFAGGTVGAVLGHEEGSATGDTLDGSEETAATGVLGVGGHLDGGGHPGKFASLGDDGVVVVEGELEDGHGGADDAMVHSGCLLLPDEYNGRVDPHPGKTCQSLRSRRFRSGLEFLRGTFICGGYG